MVRSLLSHYYHTLQSQTATSEPRIADLHRHDSRTLADRILDKYAGARPYRQPTGISVDERLQAVRVVVADELALGVTSEPAVASTC